MALDRAASHHTKESMVWLASWVASNPKDGILLKTKILKPRRPGTLHLRGKSYKQDLTKLDGSLSRALRQ